MIGMMGLRKVLVSGGTGLVGGQVVRRLVGDERVASVCCLLRQAGDFSHDKLVCYEINFDELDQHEEVFSEISDVVCCMGTTMKKAKTREEFMRVDYEIPLQVAKMARSHGVSSYSLVSSVGANEASSSFYLQVKGKLETELKKCGFERLMIYRPSLLLGDRKEWRLGEQLMTLFFKAFAWLIPTTYQATDAMLLAQNIHADIHRIKEGVYVGLGAKLRR